jgi:predicted cupin superfamily sugar epimerase
MTETRDADYWIDHLGLVDHREGGHYTETYESDVVVDGEEIAERYDADRASASSIYYLLRAEEFSTFHRIDSDELWHFYRGDPLRLYVLDDDGVETVLLGRDRFQVAIPHDTWFAAEIAADVEGATDHGYALVGCDVTPAFDEVNYELADERLADEYEQHRELIERLT